MFTRRLRATMTSFVVVGSAAGLILVASGATQFDAPGLGPMGVATASAELPAGPTAAELTPRHQANSTVFIPGTWNPGEVGSTSPGQEHVVGYAAAPPVIGNYTGSVNEGGENAAGVVRSMPLGSEATISGFSQGGQAARNAANQPGVAANYQVTVVTTGDPCTEGTGVLARSREAQMLTGTACTSLPPNVHGVVINRVDDPIANLPTELNGVTVLNAILEYSYCHASGYGPADLNRPDVRSRDVGNITYVTIPADSTPALVRWARDSGFYVSPEMERDIRNAVARPDPGPGGALPPPAELPVHQTAASVEAPVLATPDPLTQAAETLEQAWQSTVVDPFVDQVEAFANGGTNQAAAPVTAPSGNVQELATVVESVLPQQAPLIDQVALQLQNSPLGGFINGLP